MHDIDQRLGELLFQVLYLFTLALLGFHQVDGTDAEQAVDVDDHLLGCRRGEPARAGIVASGTAVIQMGVGYRIGRERAGVVGVRLVAVLVG